MAKIRVKFPDIPTDAQVVNGMWRGNTGSFKPGTINEVEYVTDEDLKFVLDSSNQAAMWDSYVVFDKAGTYEFTLRTDAIGARVIGAGASAPSSIYTADGRLSTRGFHFRISNGGGAGDVDIRRVEACTPAEYVIKVVVGKTNEDASRYPGVLFSVDAMEKVGYAGETSVFIAEKSGGQLRRLVYGSGGRSYPADGFIYGAAGSGTRGEYDDKLVDEGYVKVRVRDIYHSGTSRYDWTSDEIRSLDGGGDYYETKEVDEFSDNWERRDSGHIEYTYSDTRGEHRVIGRAGGVRKFLIPHPMGDGARKISAGGMEWNVYRTGSSTNYKFSGHDGEGNGQYGAGGSSRMDWNTEYGVSSSSAYVETGVINGAKGGDGVAVLYFHDLEV